MTKSILFYLLFILCCTQLQAQQNPYLNYRLQSEGNMPTMLKSYIQTDNTYFISRLCRNGKIVYGSPVNRYLETIVDNLLVNEPELRSKITIFVVKSPIVNAFAFSNGVLLVDIGIIAQASNEAEIAFFLSHEIAHYAQNHTYIDIDYNRNVDILIQKHSVSREQENDADLKGIERFYVASNYSYSAIDGAFDVLQFGYLPFDNYSFEHSLVENSCYHFPDDSFLSEVKPISNRDDYLDTLSTHPNIAKRRLLANSIIVGKNDSGRELFVQSELLFNEIRTLCRAECINQWLIQHDYVNAYYNAFVLLKEDQDHLFYQNAMAIALYGLSKHKTQATYREVIPKYTNFEGEQQAAYFFFEKVGKQELNLLALKALWNMKKLQPHNTTIADMTENLIHDLLSFNLTLNNFSDYAMDTDLDTFEKLPTTEIHNAKGKYERIKSGSNTPQKITPSDQFKLYQFMLCDLKQDSSFINYMQLLQNSFEDEQILSLLKQKPNFKEETRNFFFIQPYYQYFDKNDMFDAKKNKNGVITTEKALKKCAKKFKIDYHTIHYQDLGGDKHSVCGIITNAKSDSITNQYNSYCDLQEWLENGYLTNKEMVSHLTLDLNDLKKDSRYVVISTTKVFQENFFNYIKINDIVLSTLSIYAFPFTITKLFIPLQSFGTLLAVVDVDTGKTVSLEEDTFYKSDNIAAHQHAFIYDFFYTMMKGAEK